MAKAHEDFLLTTKLFCGKCEHMKVGESGKSHTGAMHYYYKCGNAKRRKGCDKKAVKKDWIERAVVRLPKQKRASKIGSTPFSKASSLHPPSSGLKNWKSSERNCLSASQQPNCKSRS